MDHREIVNRINKLSISVTEWEAGFIESVLKRNQKYFTDKQKAVIERMKDRYLPSEFEYISHPVDDDDDIPF